MIPAATVADGSTVRARDAVAWVFVLNGLLFATWVARIPEARGRLGLDNAGLGLLLLALAVGSLAALSASGALVERLGTTRVVRLAAGSAVAGLLVTGGGLAGGAIVPAAVGLALYGAGTGAWDVAMNVAGSRVEQQLGRTVMPRFHAAFSIGTVGGAATGAGLVAAGVPVLVHLGAVAISGAAAAAMLAARFLPEPARPDRDEHQRGAVASAWREPRTLLLGVMVLALALTEGTANDWLAVALVDGHDLPRWVGVAGFGLFVAAMTAGRLVGPVLLDRHGRPTVLWVTMATAALGALLVALPDHPVPVVAGIVLWGAGASLGFPVGMSAAGDDPVRASARVSVVSTIGYAAFLAGPPLLGLVADRVGTLRALLVVSLVLLPSALVVPAARKRPVRR
jgi:predicted MFS family arabinose efflux permease